MIRQGSVGQALASAPPADRGTLAMALRSSFAAGLNDLLYVTAGVAIVGAVFALLLIRRKDFVVREPADPASEATATAPQHAAAPDVN
jgi:hypothetical protein